MRSVNIWNAKLYDHKLGYVSQFGKSIVDMLQPKKGEKILDVGCGTGNLTNEISLADADVIGMDASEEMIDRAKEKYPHLSFTKGDATTFRTDEKFDAVFSNAALHWMTRADKVVESIYQALLPGGRFVAEFGGKGNIHIIMQGITEVLFKEREIDVTGRNPWYFPSVGEYSSLLENHGFTVTFAHLFERPTQLTDGDKGLDYWLDSFADDFFLEFSETERVSVYEQIKDYVRSTLYKNGTWELDYKRIRVVAIK